MECDAASAPSLFSSIFGVVIVAGTIVSYTPQYYSLYAKKTSIGLSHFALAFGLLSGLLTIIDTVILSWKKITCCTSLTILHCLLNNLLVLQVFTGPTCVFFLYVMYLFYLSRYDLPNASAGLPEYFSALVSLGAVLVSVVVLVTVALVLHFGRLVVPVVVVEYGKVIGLIAAGVVFFHWTPQLWETWRLSRSGALSLMMLGVQCPGAIMVVAFQLVVEADWTIWAPMLVSVMEQLILIGMLVYFRVRDGRRGEIVGERVLLTPDEKDGEEEEDNKVFQTSLSL